LRGAPATGQAQLNFLEFHSQDNFQRFADDCDAVQSFRPERLPDRYHEHLLEGAGAMHRPVLTALE
jgi:hypothetical protein